MGEIWDIYDVNKQLTGRTMKRNDWNMKDEEIILKKRIIILLISISLTWILQKQIYIYRQKRLPVSDLLQQKKSRLSLTEENFFITTA